MEPYRYILYFFVTGRYSHFLHTRNYLSWGKIFWLLFIIKYIFNYFIKCRAKKKFKKTKYLYKNIQQKYFPFIIWSQFEPKFKQKLITRYISSIILITILSQIDTNYYFSIKNYFSTKTRHFHYFFLNKIVFFS